MSASHREGVPVSRPRGAVAVRAVAVRAVAVRTLAVAVLVVLGCPLAATPAQGAHPTGGNARDRQHTPSHHTSSHHIRDQHTRDHQGAGGRDRLGPGDADRERRTGRPTPPPRRPTGAPRPVNAGAALPSAEELIDHLRRRLNASAMRPVLKSGVPGDRAGRYLRALGPDLFGARGADPPPRFLKGFRLDKLKPEEQFDFFDKVSLTRTAPRAEDLRSLVPDADSVITGNGRTAAKVWKSIWFGSPLRADGVDGEPGPMARFRSNLAHAATTLYPPTSQERVRFVVFTDVPRADFDRVRDRTDARGLSRYDAGVHDMLTWARDHGISLVNYFEIYNSERPGALMPFIRAEQAKPNKSGKAAMSDLARYQVEADFGGGYNDGDNVYRPGLIENMRAALASTHGYGRLSSGNTLFFGPAGHAMLRAYVTEVMAQYAKYQDQVMPDGYFEVHPHQGLITLPPEEEVRYRAAPAIGNAELKAGILGQVYRAWPSVTMGLTYSWRGQPEPIVTDADQTRRLTEQVVATLVKELWNRRGDLHLTLVEPAVRRHARPDLIWNAAIGFLYSVPELRHSVRSVTDQRTEGNLVVELPARARRLLDIRSGAPFGHAEADPSRTEILRGGERSYPARMGEPGSLTSSREDSWVPVGPPPGWLRNQDDQMQDDSLDKFTL